MKIFTGFKKAICFDIPEVNGKEDLEVALNEIVEGKVATMTYNHQEKRKAEDKDESKNYPILCTLEISV